MKPLYRFSVDLAPGDYWIDPDWLAEMQRRADPRCACGKPAAYEYFDTTDTDPVRREVVCIRCAEWIGDGAPCEGHVTDPPYSIMDLAEGVDAPEAMALLVACVRVLRSANGGSEMAGPRRRVRGTGACVSDGEGARRRAVAGGHDRGDQRGDAADDDTSSGDRRAR